MTWKDIPGWYDWAGFYTDVVRRYNGGLLVEVGCYLGRSLCHLGQLVKESGKPFTVIGVDTCTGSGEENGYDNHANEVALGGGTFAGQLHRNILKCGLGRHVGILTLPSARAATLFPPGGLVMAFLDARHDYPAVREDIQAWLPKVGPGGIIAGDDIGIPNEERPVWPGVKQAVSELLPGFRYEPHDAWAYEVR
jgi:hypothetical protein